ncbi:hypothetical protein V1951_18470 [Yersinia sp. 2544 StPb PI]|uniref:hypothetical protein n=1 Tax=Yersinia sp. 2544 StPb PI TaxID=3117409 RepID=UPI003B28A478
MTHTEIIMSVRSGMESAAKDAISMNLYSGAKIGVEYLATVSIGQALVRSKTYRRGDHELHFEYSTKKFISSTVPLIKKMPPLRGHIFSRSIVRKLSNTTRNGRIDIALLNKNMGVEFPLCAIEVKGDNPSKKLLINDLKRNLECMIYSAETGRSGLDLTLSCSFFSYVNNSYCVKEEHEKQYVENVKEIFDSKISCFRKTIPSDISLNVEVFTLSKILAPDNADQEDFERIEDEIHLSLGVIVYLERNCHPSVLGIFPAQQVPMPYC